MNTEESSFLDHVAIHVKDINWHVRFFSEVLGMPPKMMVGPTGVIGPTESPQQVWTIGGMQLVSEPEFTAPEGRLAHLGIKTVNVEAVIDAAESWGVTSLARGRNWLLLPDGLCIELLSTSPKA